MLFLFETFTFSLFDSHMISSILFLCNPIPLYYLFYYETLCFFNIFAKRYCFILNQYVNILL